MDLSGLTFDQAPPYHGVQRFFLTAPVFLVIAALVMIFFQGSLFISFISFPLIGFVHLITLGFITMTMMGAFTQMLPVLAGVKIARPVMFAGIVHGGMILGILLFFLAYFFQWFFLVPFAALALFISMAMFAGHILPLLYRVKKVTDTIRAMRLSVISLSLVLLFGVIMLLWRIDVLPDFGINLLPVHIGWAIFGWISILIMGVTFQVVPMFYVAPEHPVFARRQIPTMIFALLIVYSVLQMIPWAAEKGIAMWLRLIIYNLSIIFATSTLGVLQKRKRRLPDPTLLFWKTSMVFLIISMSLAIFLEFYRGPGFPYLIVVFGLIFFFGFVVSLVNGMMYKIVPFLSWFHLASKGNFSVPTMKEMLSDTRVKIQFVMHLVFVLSAPALAFFPGELQIPAGILLLVSSLTLCANLASVIRKYLTAKGNSF